MQLQQAEKILKALANRRRLEILKFLKRGKRASVGAIAKEIALSFRATSKHLTILAGATLLDRKQSSLSVFYKIAEDIPEFTKKLVERI